MWECKCCELCECNSVCEAAERVCVRVRVCVRELRVRGCRRDVRGRRSAGCRCKEVCGERVCEL